MTDLFAGPGGMTLGARTAGAPGIGIEWDANAVATRRANGLPTVHADVRNHGPADFPDRRTLKAGPPCQTFTMAGKGSGRAEIARLVAAVHGMAAGIPAPTFADERTGLVLEPLRWILGAECLDRPYETIVLEQVPKVLPIWHAYAHVLERLGYGAATGILRTEQYGLPQTRRRAVLVARYAADAHLPAP
ncbi:DNA cytosine methyltransferase, partial [Streptomyces virginiae]